MVGRVEEITASQANDFLLPRHYSGRKPQISKAYGWFYDNELKAVCTFGKPASNSLCIGVCGAQHSASVYELNRLCRVEDWEQPLSCFVSACLRRLRSLNWIVVSYSDTQMGHHGYIYQACNFMYTGCTKARTDKYTPSGKHSRHYTGENDTLRKVRSAKHRYVFFCTFNRAKKRQWANDLKYPILPYPKGDNSQDYILGDYMKDIYITKGETNNES